MTFLSRPPGVQVSESTPVLAAPQQVRPLSGFVSAPKGPSGRAAQAVGPAAGADPGEGRPAAAGPEAAAVPARMRGHLGVDWRQGRTHAGHRGNPVCLPGSP